MERCGGNPMLGSQGAKRNKTVLVYASHQSFWQVEVEKEILLRINYPPPSPPYLLHPSHQKRCLISKEGEGKGKKRARESPTAGDLGQSQKFSRWPLAAQKNKLKLFLSTLGAFYYILCRHTARINFRIFIA